MRPTAKIASARSMYWLLWIRVEGPDGVGIELL